MLWLDCLGRLEISDRTRNLQDSVVGTSAEIELTHCHTDQLLRVHPKFAVRFQVACRHSGVARRIPIAAEPSLLSFSCSCDPVPNSGGPLLRPRTSHLAVFYRRHFDQKVDPVMKRSGDALTIALHLNGSAAAFTFQVAKVPARARVHRRNQHEFARESDGASRT